MHNYLIDRLPEHRETLAIADENGEVTYQNLEERVDHWRTKVSEWGIKPGEVVTIEGHYGLESIALLLVFMENENIIVPLSSDSMVKADKFVQVAEVGCRVDVQVEPATLTRTKIASTHKAYDELRKRGHPGLVLFTSGSTGENKAAVHDLHILLEKFKTPRNQLCTLVFLQLDHIGGVNTLFYTLANGGTIVVPRTRTPETVCDVIERYGVELLPTSPTFLNLLLLSGEVDRHDLSSLKLITYGTEPMPQSTLERVAHTFPDVKLQQTYGMTEFGILRSKSMDSKSLWVKVGGEDYQTKVVDGRLWVKARTAMLGYLNAPNPFDEEGFMDTGDQVEVDGEWLRILGRDSEIINVGGSKVYPAEVESVLLEMDEIVDVAVRGESHPITGQIVVAKVFTEQETKPRVLKAAIAKFCRDKMPGYAVPAKLELAAAPLHSERFKKMRRA